VGFPRKHLSYANVALTLVLVFAMSGGAFAADSSSARAAKKRPTKYLITSIKQISPSVLKQIETKVAGRLKEGPSGKEGPAGKEGGQGAPGKEGLSLLSGAEQTALKSILPYITLLSKGVDGKPTIEFSGVNVEVLSGAGKTNAAVNGEGNLIIGYNELPGTQTGSHNLVIGDGHSFTSYGGLVAGHDNTVSGPYATVAGGEGNVATGAEAAVMGGTLNLASGAFSSVAGGCENLSGSGSPLSGSCTEGAQSILGGFENTASGVESTVSGGEVNAANGGAASIAGGQFNTASGGAASVAGGDENEASESNTASATASSVLGGDGNTASSNCQAIPAAPGAC
jgi:hypothetical protein